METDRYIRKWLEGTLNKQEREEFEKTKTYRELKKILDSVQHFRATEFDTDSELDRFNHRKSHKGKEVYVNWQKILLRVAAMLTIVAGSYFYITYFLPTTVETTTAEKTQLYLPDSSEVILNAVSKIVYNKNRWANNREVKLEGEAFFKVRKGSKFDVETSMGTVSVLGTQFNVKQRKDFLEVACYEGLVALKSDIESSKIPANQKISIINGIVTKSNISSNNLPDWLNNESIFISIPLIQVINEFERQYGYSMISEELEIDKLFTGRFPHDDMTVAIKSITIPLNLTYQITEDQRIILSRDIK